MGRLSIVEPVELDLTVLDGIFWGGLGLAVNSADFFATSIALSVHINARSCLVSKGK
jgi:hypothetical protein